MIHDLRRGALPAKPHTVFRAPDGVLLHEHCFTSVGFDGPYSVLYHRHPPQNHGAGRWIEPLWPERVAATPLTQTALRRRHLRTPQTQARGSAATGRVPLLFNSDLTLGVVRPVEADAFTFVNADGDDLFYIHRGGGELRSWFGTLPFAAGDYVYVPRGTAHRMLPDRTDQHWLWIELRSGMHLPKQYRNGVGQLRMDAPYGGRDFRAPTLAEAPFALGAQGIDDDAPRLDDGGWRVVTKRCDRFSEHRWPTPPLDVVGWAGAFWPFAFPIRSFQPKIGQIHLPPTVHGTFASGGSLVCSFVPRLVDFHDQAIPCPYPHSNLEVDEVLFYCDGDFTSRRGIDAGSISLHPAGVPHGPHPGAYEASIGSVRTFEMAVMIDTYAPLEATAAGVAIEEASYDDSWSRPGTVA